MSEFLQKYNEHQEKIKQIKALAHMKNVELQSAYQYRDNLYDQQKIAEQDVKKKQEEYFELLSQATSEITILEKYFQEEISRLKLV